MNALTLRRTNFFNNDLSVAREEVNYTDLRKIAKRYNAHFQILGKNGAESGVFDRATLAQLYPDSWIKILCASGNFAVVGEKWIVILEA